MIHASRPLECIIHARENFGTWLKHARENSCKGALLRTPRYHIINWCEIISDQTRSLKWEDLYKHFGLIRMCEPENKHWRRSQHGEKYSQLWDRPHHHPQKTGKSPGTDRITPLWWLCRCWSSHSHPGKAANKALIKDLRIQIKLGFLQLLRKRCPALFRWQTAFAFSYRRNHIFSGWQNRQSLQQYQRCTSPLFDNVSKPGRSALS